MIRLLFLSPIPPTSDSLRNILFIEAAQAGVE